LLSRYFQLRQVHTIFSATLCQHSNHEVFLKQASVGIPTLTLKTSRKTDSEIHDVILTKSTKRDWIP
jgi:hypothetical protein